MRAAARAGLVTASLWLCACGYALVGKGTAVDPSIKRIGVPVFRDATGKPGLDQEITDRVVEELLKRGRFEVVKDATDVDAVVEGELTAYTPRPVGFSADGGSTQASRYSVTLTARVRYYKVGEKEPIWSNDSFSFQDEYEVNSDPSGFFDREDQAVRRVCGAFARSLVAQMLEAF